LSKGVDALAQGQLLVLVDPSPLDATLDREGRLAMVVDVHDVDLDRRAVASVIGSSTTRAMPRAVKATLPSARRARAT
jgi:hypothetical protein